MLNEEYLLKLRKKHVTDGLTTLHPITIERGENARLYSVDGREFIDFTCGIGVTNLGHCNEEVVRAAEEQLRKLWHIAFVVAGYESYYRAAEALCRVAPGRSEKKAAFFNSGAEAVENAVKTVRRATGKMYILSFENSFHGRTYLTMAATGKYEPYKVDFEPFAPGVELVPFPYCYRCPFGQSYPDCGLACISYIERFFFHTRVPARKIAAILVEPIQGEGGFVVPPDSFFPELKRIANEHDIKLIIDEVQTGFGRTGRMFAIEHWGIEPDLMTVGKALANGLPLSGLVARREILDLLYPGSVGGTYVGNPVACAAAAKVIEIFERDRIPERAARLGEVVRKRMEEMHEEHELVGDVRGRGLMMALELVKDRKNKEPAAEETKKVIEKARERGLLLLKAGLYNNVIRIHPPLTIEEELLERGLDVIDDALKEAEKG